MSRPGAGRSRGRGRVLEVGVRVRRASEIGLDNALAEVKTEREEYLGSF